MQKKGLGSSLVKEYIDNETNSLNASSKGLTHIEDDISEFTAKIRKLDISFNYITNLKYVSNQIPQLRQLDAFCCQITTLDDLSNVSNKLEVIHLQQNGINSIPKVFTSYIKLKELRLDRNKLDNIRNLNSCVSLQHLNLSNNKLTSVDGFEGLQNLEELILHTNQISSIQNLKSLPSMTELDISFNNLKSLDGIQNLPMLQSIRATNNHITTLVIPTSLSQRSRKPADIKSESIKKNSKTSASSQISKTEESSLKDIQNSKKLTDVYLSHNHITSMSGIDSLGTNIELFDLSHNLLDVQCVDGVTSHDFVEFISKLIAKPLVDEASFSSKSTLSKFNGLQYFSKLLNMNLSGNPFFHQLVFPKSLGNSSEEIFTQKFIEKVLPYCSNIRIVNNYKILFDENEADKSDAVHALVKNYTLKYQDFSTWKNENDQPEIDGEDNDSEKKVDEDKKISKIEKISNTKDQYHVNMTNMSSLEEINDKEHNFRDVLARSRSRLMSLFIDIPPPPPVVVTAGSTALQSSRLVTANKPPQVPADTKKANLEDMSIHAVKVLPVPAPPSLNIPVPLIITDHAVTTDSTTRYLDPGVQMLQQRQLQSTPYTPRQKSVEIDIESIPSQRRLSKSIGFDIRSIRR